MDEDDKHKGPEAPPFSHETLVLYQRLQQATSKEERARLTVELAARFAAEYDSADATATDDFHLYFDEYEKARLEYQQKAMRVGRLASDLIKQFLEATPTTVEELTRETLSRTMN